MFAPGDTEIPDRANTSASAQEKHRRCLAFVRSAFLDHDLELLLRQLLPDEEAAAPPTLPLGWEQRSHAGGKVTDAFISPPPTVLAAHTTVCVHVAALLC